MPKENRRPDYVLLGISAVLLVLGMVMIFSVSASLSQEKFGNTYYFLKHQVLFGLIPGLILAFLVFKIPLYFFKKWAPFLLLINLILVAAVFSTKVGTTFGGASRWIAFGPISFQPSELLKLTFILYLASWLTSRTEKIPEFKKRRVFNQTFIAFIFIIGLISALLIFQPDVSTLGIIIFVGLLMYFFSGTPLWHTIFLILMGLGSLSALIKFKPYRFNRLLVFLRPETDPMGIGYQIKQALITVGSGGLFGLGLGMSHQKFGFLPQPISDSIFSIFAEETGFLGSAILLFLFLIFFWRGLKISKESPDKFSQMVALGISLWIIMQSFVNIGSMIGILPLSGIPLPFISYGGTHFVAEMVGIGILLNISKTTRY
jgi:cell division protein FtsW